MGAVAPGALDTLAEFVAEIGDCADLVEFRGHAPALLRRLIPCDTASYNEVGDTPEDVIAITDPAEHITVRGVAEGFAQYANQSPLVCRSRDPSAQHAMRLSDFIGMRALRGLDLYQEVYRPLEIGYQLAITVPSSGRVIGLTVNRGSRDFSDRDRALLDAAGPFLRAAYRNVSERSRLEASFAALDRATNRRRFVLIVEHDGELRAGHAGAERILGDLARDRTARETLRSWVSARTDESELQLQLGSRPMVARYLAGRPGHPDTILISPPPAAPGPAALRPLGLTTRQAQILYLVWEGRSNSEIALALQISEHTVRHHLEHLYARLGVTSRGAAAQRATQQLMRADTGS
jgi:DNA-binding NarL/FixJ family response regulator